MLGPRNTGIQEFMESGMLRNSDAGMLGHRDTGTQARQEGVPMRPLLPLQTTGGPGHPESHQEAAGASGFGAEGNRAGDCTQV